MSVSPDGAISRSTGASALSLYHLLDPDVLANPYPLFRRLRTEDPVHWDPFLHTWVVTRYVDVLEVLHTFSANRTHTPEKLQAMGKMLVGGNPKGVVVGVPVAIDLVDVVQSAQRIGRLALCWKHGAVQGQGRKRLGGAIEAVCDKGLIDVLHDLEVGGFKAHVGGFQTERRGDLPLDGQIPILGIHIVEIRIDGCWTQAGGENAAGRGGILDVRRANGNRKSE